MEFAFFFVIWAPALALQVASVLKEGLKVNLKYEGDFPCLLQLQARSVEQTDLQTV